MKFFTNSYQAIIQFCLRLINVNDPYQVHNLTNLIWGIGSFLFYWLDHFMSRRQFTNDDYWFILGMCGLSAGLAVANNRVAKNTGAPMGTPFQSIEKKEEQEIGNG